MDATASTAAQLRHTDSGPSTPSIPLRLLRRSGSSQGSGGSSKYAGGTGPRTLMFFKGCPRPLGCTVLLQGADAEQLTLLKKVMKVVIIVTIVRIVVMMIIIIMLVAIITISVVVIKVRMMMKVSQYVKHKLCCTQRGHYF